jgi:hypothetical protein
MDKYGKVCFSDREKRKKKLSATRSLAYHRNGASTKEMRQENTFLFQAHLSDLVLGDVPA